MLVAALAADASEVQLQGPPTRYTADVEHYRFNGTCDIGNPSFYPVPQDPVTRATYLRCLEARNPSEIARNPNRGTDGPRVFMPVLVKYVQTGDPAWADACIAMLRAFHAEMQKQVAERKWFWQFEHPSPLIPLYRQYLIRGGAMKPDASWFRERQMRLARDVSFPLESPRKWISCIAITKASVFSPPIVRSAQTNWSELYLRFCLRSTSRRFTFVEITLARRLRLDQRLPRCCSR